MTFLECIHVCNNARLEGYVPWRIESDIYGWIAPAFAAHLQRFPEVFLEQGDGIHLHPALVTRDERSMAVSGVMRQLHQEGVIDAWVGEAYPVLKQFGESLELVIERAAASFMGVKSFGVHMNGLVKKTDGVYVWVGVRSRTKPFWPGKYDQMVAGGQPIGIGLLDNVIKEAKEEASVPTALAATAQPVGQIHYRQESQRGLDNSTLFVYDLWLPEDFAPKNTDGEVEQFELMSLTTMAELTSQVTRFKDNCNLVNIDLLMRQGVISPQHPEYAALRQALYIERGAPV